jgi:hypothetical protein
MTAGPAENAAAASAQVAGMADTADWMGHAQQLHTGVDSQGEMADVQRDTDTTAVDWPGGSNTQPATINPQATPSQNVTNPTDVHQSSS